MPITSDITIDVSKFRAENVAEETKKINAIVEAVTANTPKWNEIGAAKYRKMRETGETPLPMPVFLPEAIDTTVPSRDTARDIPMRVLKPSNRQPSRGVLIHFHGGGFVLGSHMYSDNFLRMYADKCQVTAISVGYRHAPEDPYPAGAHDCIDAAEYLVDHAEKEYGAPLRFIAGESAGGCLTALTAFELMRSRPSHRLSGLIYHYGEFDLSLELPSVISYTKPLVVNRDDLEQFNSAYVPGMSPAERRHPGVSPLYEDMVSLAAASPIKSLPPALFICGTEDPLLDDTLLMSAKWTVGGEAIVKIYPGACHGFTIAPGLPVAEEALDVTVRFVREKLDV